VSVLNVEWDNFHTAIITRTDFHLFCHVPDNELGLVPIHSSQPFLRKFSGYTTKALGRFANHEGTELIPI